MSNLHRLTVAAYALNAVVFAWSASLPTGHAWHILACVVWVGLTGLAWHNGRNDARLREAARLSAMADGMSSVAGGVEHMAKEIGQVAHDIAAAAYGAAAEKRTEAHPDCVTFTLPSDALIPWVYPYGCESPNLERYADGEWFTHQGQPCGNGGTCSDSARCEP